MKTTFTKTLLAIIIAIVVEQNFLFAQNWQATASGNNFTPAPGSGVPVLGSSAISVPTKRDIQFKTLGLERMRLMGEPGANLGYLGLGTTAPHELLHIHDGGFATNIQITNVATTSGINKGYQMGIDNVGMVQHIQNTFQPLAFWMKSGPLARVCDACKWNVV